MSVVLLLALCCLGCPAQQANQKTKARAKTSAHPLFLWKATNPQNPKSELYIYGGFPSSLKGRGTYDTAVKAVFTRSEIFVTEVDYKAPKLKRWIRIYVQRYGILPPGTKLHRRLSRVTLKYYLRACKSLGISPLMLARMRPWLASTYLQGLHFQLQHYNTNKNKEVAMAQMARMASKKIHSLFPPKEAFQPYGELSSKAQNALMLQASLSVLHWSRPTHQAKMRKAYRRGNAWEIDRLLFAPLNRYINHVAELRKIHTHQNIRTVQALKEVFSAKDKRFFVAVGTERLSGQSGILQLLKNEGFALQRIPGNGLYTENLAGPTPAARRTPQTTKTNQGKAKQALFLNTTAWIAVKDQNYGFYVRMPGRPEGGDQLLRSGFGTMSVRAYQYNELAMKLNVVGYRYPVEISFQLRKARFRAKFLRTFLTKYLRKNGGKLLRQVDGLRFAGCAASYIKVLERTGVSEGYLLYYQGQLFFIVASYIGRTTKRDYRRKLTRAFFRSFHLLPALRRR